MCPVLNVRSTKLPENRGKFIQLELSSNEQNTRKKNAPNLILKLNFKKILIILCKGPDLPTLVDCSSVHSRKIFFN